MNLRGFTLFQTRLREACAGFHPVFHDPIGEVFHAALLATLRTSRGLQDATRLSAGVWATASLIELEEAADTALRQMVLPSGEITHRGNYHGSKIEQIGQAIYALAGKHSLTLVQYTEQPYRIGYEVRMVSESIRSVFSTQTSYRYPVETIGTRNEADSLMRTMLRRYTNIRLTPVDQVAIEA